MAVEAAANVLAIDRSKVKLVDIFGGGFRRARVGPQGLVSRAK